VKRFLVAALVLVGIFVFLHTGARGAGVCEEEAWPIHHLSWWPPGVECAGGLPEVSETKLNVAMLLALPAVLLVIAAAPLLVRRKSQ
jgi:hypothetical protein